MTAARRASVRGTHAAIGAAMVLGLALRIAVARGGLWLDEAWTAKFVAQAGDPIGVVWQINHDNNHFLNSWWMLLVGPYAPTLLVRALSIATGIGAVAVAAAIGLRRGPATGILAALLFAISPILVAYGAEARGYGPMLLAMLISILAIDRWLDGERAPPVWPLAILTLLGMLAQFTYIFALAALGGWIVFTLARRMSFDAAVKTTMRTLAPSLAAVALVIALVVAAARASATGFQAGGYMPFTAGDFLDALSEAIVYTLGLSLAVPIATIAIAFVAIVAAIRLARGATGHRYFHVFALLAFPVVLGLALSRIGNAGFARYYLVLCVALLLLVAEVAGSAITRGGWRRVAALAFVAIVTVASLVRDDALATSLRGDPARAIAAMRAAAPAGASVVVDTIRPTAVLAAAARTAAYPLDIRQACPAADFAFVELNKGQPAESAVQRCGLRYARRTVGRYVALAGVDWALYARVSPQTAIISRH